MNKNATAAAVDAEDAAGTDEAAFAADAEDELRAADTPPKGDEPSAEAAPSDDEDLSEQDEAALEDEISDDEDPAEADEAALEDDVSEDELAEDDDLAREDEISEAPALEDALPEDEDPTAAQEQADADPAEDAHVAQDAPEADDAPDLAQDDDIWRARAAQLLGAGLASHVITLTGAAAEDENLALEPLLDLASGALFRLSPGRFAAMLDDPEAAADAVDPDVALDPIADLAPDAPEDAADTAAAPSPLALVAPFAAAALQAGGPRVVIDADYAIAAAARTADGIARIIADADVARSEAETAALARIEDRLARTETALEAVLAAVTQGEAPIARAAAPANGTEDSLAAHIDASVDRAVAAVRADILKSARARRDADRRSLEPALDRLQAAADALEQDRRVSAGRSDAYAETIRAIVGEMLARAPGAAGDKS